MHQRDCLGERDTNDQIHRLTLISRPADLHSKVHLVCSDNIKAFWTSILGFIGATASPRDYDAIAGDKVIVFVVEFCCLLFFGLDFFKSVVDGKGVHCYEGRSPLISTRDLRRGQSAASS